jgi:hypothetical protein
MAEVSSKDQGSNINGSSNTTVWLRNLAIIIFLLTIKRKKYHKFFYYK